MDAISRSLAFVLALLAVTATPTVDAQESAPAPAEATAATTFTVEQLEQIAAPIALHPDTLLTMIMMASTYPLEIVEAHRWIHKNASLTGKALEEALKAHDWDPSVKSICTFPTVLKQMNDNLDWTQDLGDAFLGQKKELLDTVQKMRRKALESGNLKSTEQQKVSEDEKIIIIESTKTEVVYVPTYAPTVVYGSWYYPTYYYPPMYYPPPPGAALFVFSVGVAWGAGCWGHCNWHGGDVNINVNNFNQYNQNTNLHPEKHNLANSGSQAQSWNHNPEHRKGANYKNSATAQKYGAAPGTNRVTKDQARGYERSSAGKAPAAGGGSRPAANTPGGSRPAANNPSAGAGGGARPTAGTAGADASRGARPTPKAEGNSGGALSGSRSPSLDRSASTRGASSRGAGASGASRGGGGKKR